jgi:uncharacterized protein (DUF1330 family)
MKTRSVAILSLFAAALLGGAAIQGLHAQSKAPVYVVTELDSDQPPEMFLYFEQTYGPKFRELIKSHGGRVVALGIMGGVTRIEGERPPLRAEVQVWDSRDQLHAYRNDPQFKELRTIGEKYARFYSYAVDGFSE